MSAAEGAPRLSHRASGIRDTSDVAAAIRRAILGSGEVADDASPKLMEMTSPRLLSTAYLMALRRSESWFDFANTRTIFAPGAILWAHSTSRLISSAHPVMLGSPGTNGVRPSGAIWVRFVGGRP